MTQPQEKKEFREFWVEANPLDTSLHIASSIEPKFPDSPVGTIKKRNIIHLIEHAALVASQNEVKALKAEVENLNDNLASNMCGYCWREMEAEPTVKMTQTEFANKLSLENAELKRKLEEAQRFAYRFDDYTRHTAKCENKLIDCICDLSKLRVDFRNSIKIGAES